MKSCRYHTDTPAYAAEREYHSGILSERQDCPPDVPLSSALMTEDRPAVTAVPEIPASMKVLDCLPAAVLVVDDFGRLSYFNHKASEYFGQLEIGESWRHTIERCFIDSTNSDEMVSRLGYSLMLETEPMSDKKGQMLVFHDVSKRNNLKKIQDRYARLATLGELAAKLAHQIRTPLAASMLFFSNIKTSVESSSRQYKNLEKGMQGLRHIEAMIADMLMFTSDKSDFRDMVPVSDLIYALENEKEMLSQQYQCEIVFENRDDIADVKGNLYAIKSAIGNLVENAAQACKTRRDQYAGEDNSYRGKIYIAISSICEKGPYSTNIKITDNGVGIAEDSLAKLVKPFYTTKRNGTGLGLAVVKSVVDSHDGELQINSAIGKGTEAIIRLP
jgi:two-component system sensor histidine kinase FlrB